MHPLIPIDTKHEAYQAETRESSAWTAVVTLLIVIALLFGLAIAFSNGGDGASPEAPVPTQAPADPGV